MASVRKPHAVVFPIPLQGHINPMMMLAKHLTSAGIRVTFLHSERSLSMLHNNNSNTNDDDNNDEDDSPCIRSEVIPDSSSSSQDQHLPISSSVVLFLNSIALLKSRLEEILERLAEKGYPASCIISDSFVPWTQDVANKFGIPRIEFWCSSVTVYSMGYHIPQLINRGYLPVQPGGDQEFCMDIIPGLATFQLADFFYDLNPHAISSPIFDLVCKAFSRAKEAQRVIVNSFYDLEKDIIEAMRAEGVPIDVIGPLLPCVDCGNTDRSATQYKKMMSTSLLPEDDDCLAWLDAQATASVIYVSFGSIVSVCVEEMRELALGLEESQQPFLLVIRPGMVPESTGATPCSILPDGFEWRTEGRGRICSWAPQFAVLAHPAVGGFLTHCGWNSTLEGIWVGVPLIGCPRESEQHTNLKCLTDHWQVAIALDHTVKGKVEIKRGLVEKSIRNLMQGQEEAGESTVRRRMLGLKEAAKHAAEKGHSASSLQRLVEDIKQMSRGKNPRFLADQASGIKKETGDQLNDTYV